MAAVLNCTLPSAFQQSLSSRRTPKSNFCVRALTEVGSRSDSGAGAATPTPTFSAPPNFKPSEPKRFGVRPDKIFDILVASLALVFRLGTDVFVSRHSGSFVSNDEIPPSLYALEVAGFTVKETFSLGPRPEKPIEIYEFESSPFCRKDIVLDLVIKHAIEMLIANTATLETFVMVEDLVLVRAVVRSLGR